MGVLNACTSVVTLEEGMRVHKQIIESGWDSDVFVHSSLVDMYAKCGSLEDAWKVFNKMVSCDVVSWNATIGGCAMHGHGKEALKHFQQICEKGVQLNDIIFICLMLACSHASLVDESMHCYVSMTIVYMIFAKLEHYTYMVDLLACVDHLQAAENMIKAMPYESHVATWKALLGFAKFMVMWRLEKMLLNKFLNWRMKILQIMCCYQTFMMLVATFIFVRMLNDKEKKEA